MPFFFVFVLAGYVLGNIYVFVRGLQALGHLSFVLRFSYCALFWICFLLILTIFAFRNSKHIPFLTGHVFYQIGTGWLVFILYMIIFLACTDLIKVFNHSFNYGYYISLLLTSCLLIYGYFNYQHPKKQVFNIVINKPLAGVDQLKIVALSDWHLGFGTNKSRFKRDVDLINTEKPDIILIGGDLIDNSTTPVIVGEMEKELNRLQARLGIFMTPGNHEYISGIEACQDFLQKTNIQLLKDSLVTLPCGLQIVGRDDHSYRNRLAANDWARLTDSSKPLIIIDHQPYQLQEAQQMKADLQFSGHTHNGQVIPLNYITNYLFELGYGFKKMNDTYYYVSSGIALWGPPFRIGSQSEIVVFNCSFE